MIYAKIYIKQRKAEFSFRFLKKITHSLSLYLIQKKSL
nr:MAG TPA: hypothetical protein [Caudoviricetes sp.]